MKNELIIFGINILTLLISEVIKYLLHFQEFAAHLPQQKTIWRQLPHLLQPLLHLQ
jgi:hypothetical protein